MIGTNLIVAGDAHFHLYPCHEPASAIGCLINNLNLMAESARSREQEKDVFKIAFLAESKQHDYFHKILKKEIDFRRIDLETSAGPEEHCVSLSKQGKLLLSLVAGRQIVTIERLEILGLGMEEIVPDGLPAEEVIEIVIAAGGLPVLAFSPGKWLFKRGRLTMALIEKYSQNLLVGDSALRPLGWSEPSIMRRTRGKKLPGSDPLPLSGDEKYAGCYGFVCQGSFDTARPLTSMKKIIANSPSAIMPAGRRCSFINVAGRLFRLRRNVECRRQNEETIS